MVALVGFGLVWFGAYSWPPSRRCCSLRIFERPSLRPSVQLLGSGQGKVMEGQGGVMEGHGKVMEGARLTGKWLSMPGIRSIQKNQESEAISPAREVVDDRAERQLRPQLVARVTRPRDHGCRWLLGEVDAKARALEGVPHAVRILLDAHAEHA